MAIWILMRLQFFDSFLFGEYNLGNDAIFQVQMTRLIRRTTESSHIYIGKTCTIHTFSIVSSDVRKYGSTVIVQQSVPLFDTISRFIIVHAMCCLSHRAQSQHTDDVSVCVWRRSPDVLWTTKWKRREKRNTFHGKRERTTKICVLYVEPVFMRSLLQTIHFWPNCSFSVTLIQMCYSIPRNVNHKFMWFSVLAVWLKKIHTNM